MQHDACSVVCVIYVKGIHGYCSSSLSMSRSPTRENNQKQNFTQNLRQVELLLCDECVQ